MNMSISQEMLPESEKFGVSEKVEGMMPEEEERKMGYNNITDKGVGKEENDHNMGGFNKNTPPVDDVCPICFDTFTIPCRTNCGHWFCGSCILEFWMFRSSIQQCKCPLCCCLINNLVPDMSHIIHPSDDVLEVLKKVQLYNRLSFGGIYGLLQKVIALPLLMRKMFRILTEPDGFRWIYFLLRFIGLVLALLYEIGEYEFIPAGRFWIQRTFDIGASVLAVVLFFIGLVYRFVLRSRVRRLTVIQHEHL